MLLWRYLKHDHFSYSCSWSPTEPVLQQVSLSRYTLTETGEILRFLWINCWQQKRFGRKIERKNLFFEVTLFNSGRAKELSLFKSPPEHKSFLQLCLLCWVTGTGWKWDGIIAQLYIQQRKCEQKLSNVFVAVFFSSIQQAQYINKTMIAINYIYLREMLICRGKSKKHFSWNPVKSC